jgi:hypothetical protein
MGLKRTHWMLIAAVGGLAALLALLGTRLAGPALGQDTTVRVDSPGTASVGATVSVTINIDNVANLGAYEWKLEFDPTIVQYVDVVDGTGTPPSFLGSTGRSVSCLPPILDVGTVRFGCVSSRPPDTGPSGSDVLSTVTFKAKAAGGSSLCLRWASLTDASGEVNDIPLNPGQYQHGSIIVGGGSPPASCPPAATPTPFATATPGEPYVLTPGATATPGPPAATATPGPPAATATPQGPTPTPAPTPPPESAEVMDLIAGCNPITTTYPDGTTVQTLTAATAPAGILDAIWKFDAGVWRAYSPEFPQASDLAVTAFLDVVFLCVDAPATFVRPLV